MTFLGEFAVVDVNEIKFSPSPFDILAIPAKKKKIVMSLAESRIGPTKKKKVVMSLSEKGA